MLIFTVFNLAILLTKNIHSFSVARSGLGLATKFSQKLKYESSSNLLSVYLKAAITGFCQKQKPRQRNLFSTEDTVCLQVSLISIRQILYKLEKEIVNGNEKVN